MRSKALYSSPNSSLRCSRMRWSNRPLAISPIDSPTSLMGWANQLATKNIATATASTVTTTSTAIKPIDSRAT